MNDEMDLSKFLQDYKDALGKFIVKERLKRNWSIFELSCRSDISLNYINPIIKGRRNPSLAILLKFAKVFEMQLSEMFLSVETIMKGEN